MKNYDDFKAFYSDELLAELLELDAVRKRILIQTVIVTAILTPVLTLLIGPALSEHFPTITIISVACLSCVGIAWGASRFLGRHYRADFKRMIIKPLIGFLGPGLSYSPEGSIDLYTFRRAEIFQRYVNEFDGEDLISGTLGKTEIKFSEVKAQYVEENEDSLLNTMLESDDSIFSLLNKRKKTVFKGLFFAAEFHKDFTGQVLVLPDKAEKYFGRFGQMLQSRNALRGELIKMDNAIFEQKFVVYGSDQIQARYVLTPAIMDKILEFEKKTGDSTCLSFKNSMLYIAVPCRRNLFEPAYFKSLVDYVQTFRYFQDLRLMIGIVEEFNLNTRIWTKE